MNAAYLGVTFKKGDLDNYANGVPPLAMITIAETTPFQRKIASLLSDEERADLIAYLAEHPSAGVMIQGTDEFENCGGLAVVAEKAVAFGSSTTITAK